MTKAKSLLLGSAAALVAVSGAHAADLGLPVAPSVDYVQICTVGGFTGFLLPGSDVCFDISGFARFQATFQGEDGPGVRSLAQFTDDSNNSGDDVAMIGSAELNFDARTMTEYGLLRGFIRFEATSGGNPTLTRAFVQVGGLTAGRADSFFDPVFTGTALGPTGGMAGDTAVDLIGYSFAVGNGVTVSASFEDNEDRQVGDVAVLDYDESQTIPDFVAAIRVDQAWGSAKLAAALHEVDPFDAVRDSEFGYAIGASLNFNLPAGYTSNIGLIGAYTVGATSYIGFDGVIGGVALPRADYINGAGTSINLTTAWMLGAGFEYGITEMLDLEVDAFYADIDHDAVGLAGPDGNVWSVRGSLEYRPVAGLQIRAGVSYQSFDYNSLGASAATPADLPDDEFAARLRITRSF
jgi:hypothetical protein